MSPQLCCDELRESRPLATCAWGLSESPQLCCDELLWLREFAFSHALYIYDDEDYVDLEELDRILESYDLLEQEAYEANDVNNEEPFLRYDGTD